MARQEAIEQLFESLIEDLTGEKKEKREKEPIGMISEELRSEYMNWKNEKVELEEELEVEKERLKRKMERELTNMFEDKLFDVNLQKKKLWKKIEKELNIKGDLDLNLNVTTGVVSKWVSK